ncbi:50S ribosomal protein L20 [Candidatus Riesia sp. GBBU]|nr:50S ribosomal protein L20 [Candidatus Riesia sp. GBBU]
MTRIKRGVHSRFRHKKILKLSKGYYGARSRSYRVAKQSVIKSYQYSYRDRKKKKNFFRKLWIIRINASVRKHGITYSKFMNLLKKSSIKVNRKMLSEISISSKEVFNNLVEKVKNKTI